MLFEAGADALCDDIVAVIAPKNVRRDRIITRDNLTIEQADRRINAQKADEFYCRNGVTVLDGGTDLETLKTAASDYLSN